MRMLTLERTNVTPTIMCTQARASRGDSTESRADHVGHVRQVGALERDAWREEMKMFTKKQRAHAAPTQQLDVQRVARCVAAACSLLQADDAAHPAALAGCSKQTLLCQSNDLQLRVDDHAPLQR